LVEAKAYRNHDDVMPAGTDFAYGFVSAYQPNMKRWFVEDTVTSAIMRVQQLVMGGIQTNSAITSLVFSNTGGNLSTGTVRLYGVK